MPDRPSHDQIQKRAYELWEKRGKPHGYEMEFWAEAEREFGARPATTQRDHFAPIIADVASRAVRMPAAEREAYIALSLALFPTMYEAKFGVPAPEVDARLADHLQKWTGEAVRVLLEARGV